MASFKDYSAYSGSKLTSNGFAYLFLEAYKALLEIGMPPGFAVELCSCSPMQSQEPTWTPSSDPQLLMDLTCRATKMWSTLGGLLQAYDRTLRFHDPEHLEIAYERAKMVYTAYCHHCNSSHSLAISDSLIYKLSGTLDQGAVVHDLINYLSQYHVRDGVDRVLDDWFEMVNEVWMDLVATHGVDGAQKLTSVPMTDEARVAWLCHNDPDILNSGLKKTVLVDLAGQKFRDCRDPMVWADRLFSLTRAWHAKFVTKVAADHPALSDPDDELNYFTPLPSPIKSLKALPSVTESLKATHEPKVSQKKFFVLPLKPKPKGSDLVQVDLKEVVNDGLVEKDAKKLNAVITVDQKKLESMVKALQKKKDLKIGVDLAKTPKLIKPSVEMNLEELGKPGDILAAMLKTPGVLPEVSYLFKSVESLKPLTKAYKFNTDPAIPLDDGGENGGENPTLGE